MRLRGHHLLCVFGFQGMGYDSAHAEGMAAVVRRVRAPRARVSIVAGPDDICAACPHREREGCASSELARDRAALSALGMQVGDAEDARLLFAGVAARITPASLAALCAGCCWYEQGLCVAGLAAGRIAAGWEEDVNLPV